MPSPTDAATEEVKKVFSEEISEVTSGTIEDDEFALTQEHKDAIFKIFQQFDTDGSGSIEPKELQKLCEALGDPLDRNELTEAFDHLDVDDNGRIGFNEFITFWGES